jgi:hypothetical protein
MVQYFFDACDMLLLVMHSAFGRGDLAEVGRSGHRLKGTVADLAAKPATKAALVNHHLST